MAKWEDFYPFVRHNVQGCPVAYVENAVRSACIEFCEKTMVWQKGRMCGDIIKDEQRYTYKDEDKQSTLVQPLGVVIKDGDVHRTLRKTNREDLDSYSPDWRFAESPSPEGFFVERPNYIILSSKPTKDIPNGLHMLVALKPKRDASEIPDYIYEDWGEVIGDGALARLYAMSERVWAKPEWVGFHNRKFRAGISRAKSKVMKSYLTQSKTMAPVSF